ncbi:MAG: trigger factor [Dehalococcoidia bacterium]|nr:trigger factor [Dehalococcoidia bacterium]
MKITREDLPQREVLLNIEVEADDLVPYMDRAYQRVVQRVNIPGFRKGKAPRAVLERFVGHEALLDEAVDFLVPELVERAVKQEQIEQGGIPSVEVVQKDPVTLKATVPLAPKVLLDAYRDIRVEPEAVEVAEQEVETTLQRLRSELAPWEPVERPVAEGDQATLDVRALVGKREVANQKGVVYSVALDNPNPVLGFAQALIGAQAEERKEFTLPVPDNYVDRRLAGGECLFQVAVHQVKEKRLPDLNDEFAKGVGEGFDTLEALKQQVRTDILAQKERDVRLRYQEKVVEELVARTNVELSPMLVEHEAAHLLSDEQEALKRQQVSVEDYLRTAGRSEEQHVEEARAAATQRLTRSYALLKVAELEGLSAAPEEVEKDLNSLLESAGPQASALRRSLDTVEGRASMTRGVLNRKVMDRLVQIARGENPGSGEAAPQEAAQDESSGGTQDAGTAG